MIDSHANHSFECNIERFLKNVNTTNRYFFRSNNLVPYNAVFTIVSGELNEKQQKVYEQ